MEYAYSSCRVDVGRAIGHDLYCRSRAPLREAWLPPVREGYVAARAHGAARKLPDRYVRKWLQLRLGAFERGRVINDDVTPDLLRMIDVEHCPVTRQRLTHAELKDTDWSVDRLNNDGAYAANNLAVMSTGINRAKGGLSFEEVHARSQRLVDTDGYSPVQWLRLAALMLGPCFASRPREAPVVPLAAPMSNRSLRLIVQQIQHVFTQGAERPAGKNALIKQFKGVCVTPRSQLRLGIFAECLHQGMKGLEHRHDAWLAPAVMEAFVAWHDAMDPGSWAMAGEVARRLSGSRVIPPARLRSWHLTSAGFQS